MARQPSREKRQLILTQAKELFAHNGFRATSVADVARACEVPVGSIYTYFANKESLVVAIVEEGWEDLRARFRAELARTTTTEDRLRLVVDRFLPELLGDSDLITILLSEALEQTRLEAKLAELVSLFEEILAPLTRRSEGLAGFTRRNLESALLVYFLGVLDAVRISAATSLDVRRDDILDFLKVMMRNTLGVQV